MIVHRTDNAFPEVTGLFADLCSPLHSLGSGDARVCKWICSGATGSETNKTENTTTQSSNASTYHVFATFTRDDDKSSLLVHTQHKPYFTNGATSGQMSYFSNIGPTCEHRVYTTKEVPVHVTVVCSLLSLIRTWSGIIG